jgi:hypothetical protein
MPRATFVIFAGADQWRLGAASSEGAKIMDLSVSPDSSPEQIAALVAGALKAAGYDGQAVTLAIPSSWCFAASIDVGDLPRHDRKAMLFRLEEKLPLSAESLVADFIFHRPGQALGIGAKIHAIAPLIDALEAHAVAVQSIVPTAMLVAQGLHTDDSSRLLLFSEGPEQINLVALEGDGPVSWATAPAGAEDLRLQLELIRASLSSSPALEVVEVDARLISALDQPPKQHEGKVLTIAMEVASEVLQGRLHPWIDLRRGPLAIHDKLRLVRKPLNMALATSIALLLALATIVLVRGQRYSQIEQSSQRQLVEAFREQFPGWEVPANVRVIIQSEHRKAALASGAAQPAHPSRSALQTLLDIMTRLPREGRYSITQLSFAESSFELQGQARTNEQLDELAAAARAAGMEVQPPEARRNPEGFWNFTLRGSLPIKPDGRVAKGGS